MSRAFARLGLAATLSILAGGWLIASPPGQSTTSVPQSPRLVFRGGANLVTVDADHGSDLFTYGVVADDDLVIVAEIGSGQIEVGKWHDGGAVKVAVTGASGEQVGVVDGRIEAGTRGTLVRIPRGTSSGPWRVAVTVAGSEGSIDNRFEVRRGSEQLLSDPLLYRAAGLARGSVLRPVAEFLYHRTERVHVEWPILKPLTQRTARILDRRGQPIAAVAATLTERDEGGRAILVADLNLAQLSAGDFVLDVQVASGTETRRRQIAFRVVR